MGEVRQAGPDDDHGALLDLLQRCFAYMEGRIDPPSSLTRMRVADVSRFADENMILMIEDAGHPVACVFVTETPDSLYLGKLAVAEPYRRTGLTRRLVDAAYDIAKSQGKNRLELQTRIELVENHAAFARLGFVKTAEGRHTGYDRTTQITMCKTLSK